MLLKLFKIPIDQINLFLIILLGCFCIGNSGRVLFGFSIFDLLLLISLGWGFYICPKSNTGVFFWFFVIAFGIFSIVIARSITKSEISHSYIITELRYFLYFPLLFHVVSVYKIKTQGLKSILLFLITVYILIYLFLHEGSFLYNFFNTKLVEGEDIPLGHEGRISGPQILFLSIIVFIYFTTEDKLSIWLIILYCGLIFLVYIKTGSRTELIISALPFIALFLQKRSILPLLLIPIVLVIIPTFLNTIQLDRFYNILNPAGDSSLLYRIFNISIMLEQIFEDKFPLLLGYGIGSDYNVFLFGKEMHSYFLDSTPITLIYKIGLPLTIIVYLYLIRMSKNLSVKNQSYLLFFWMAPSLISYHLVTHQEYFLGYIFAISYFNSLNKRKSKIE
jgi:hypothetical protein